MSAKNIVFGKDLRESTSNAIKTVTKAVSPTLGPGGRLVLIEQSYGTPKMTKDGVTVAKSIELANPIENAAAAVFKTAATHTVDQAGDGTTTAIVLAEAIFSAALPAVVTGASAVKIKKGIELATNKIVKALEKLKEVITDSREKIKQTAIVSANGDEEIGEIIAKAFEKVGSDGVITVEEGKGRETELKIVEGMQFDRGFVSSYFATNQEKMIAELENPYILVYDKKISSAQSIIPILQAVHQSGKSLLLIAEDIDGEAVSTLVVNKLRGVIKVVAVKAPGFGDRRKDICQDIAILTGAKVISEELGEKLEHVTIEDLGSARKVIISSNETTIIEGCGGVAEVKSRTHQIKQLIEDSTSDYDKQKLEERLAKLGGGVAIIKVGGTTEAEAKECKDRVDDAVQAIKAAIEEGIVAGGGTALLCARRALEEDLKSMPISDERIGFEIVYKAAAAPLKTILENAGREDFAVVLNLLTTAHAEGKKNHGLDVRANKFGDMISMGVIDPAKVVRCALQNAASVAGMLLISDVSITNIPKEEKEMPAGGSGMGMY